MPVSYEKECGSMPAENLKVAYSRAGSVKTVTGTVVAGVSSATSISANPVAPLSGEPVTITATVKAGGVVDPVGTVSFSYGPNSIAGCSGRPVESRAGGTSAICETSLMGSDSPASLTATYHPSAGVDAKSSTDSLERFEVGRSPTSIELEASSSTPVSGQQITLTARVKGKYASALLEPTGVVEFMDKETQVGSCAAQPLQVSGESSTASCTISYQSIGGHRLTAQYFGDGNFAFSASGTVSVVVFEGPAAEAGQQGAGGGAQSPHGGTQGHLQLRGRTLRLRGHVLDATLACEPGARCSGPVALLAQVGSRTHRQKIVIGTARCSIPGGHKSTIKIRLTSTGSTALERAHGRLFAVLAAGSPRTTLGKVEIER